jgi:MoaA/NifB/PqqE/SkfB family radical SAM enzyme
MERGKGVLDIELYKKFLSESYEMGLREVGLYTTGEPFIIKNINDYIRLARDRGIEYIYITTNGALATPDRLASAVEAGLNSIKFSVNAGTRETYRLVHGVDDFDKVIEHIKYVSQYRKENNINMRIMVSCVVTKFLEELEEKEKLKQVILPYVDEIAFWGVSGQMGQSLEQLNLIASSMTEAMPKIGDAKPCSMLWNRFHLSHEGYLSLCCVDYENSLVYADLNTHSVKESWHNQVIKNMRKRHQDQDLDGTLCKNCLYGTRDEVYPITSIGRENINTSLLSLKEKGTESVNKRISELSKYKE